MRKKKRKLKPITGLTWTQKLAIESIAEYAQKIADEDERDLPPAFQKLSRSFRKILADFRKKTKHMHKPRRRRKKK